MKPHLPFLLLSIQAMHVERIFAGTKKFELRKAIPKSTFERVFLYESGGRGIVGAFEPGKPIRAAKKALWRRVGTRATTKERFDRYFATAKQGCAIPIKSFSRFSTPVTSIALKRSSSRFKAPMSFLLVRPGTPLYQLLDRAHKANLPQRTVSLRRIKNHEKRQFKKLVTSEIARKYDEITPKFASSILVSDKLGFDPHGILTKSKSVLTICDEKRRAIGFTTLTYKLGGSVKTGPTVLLPRFRSAGYGQATRRAINHYLTERGVRKIYCTAPDNDPEVFEYLLRAGLRIEAHLRQHYSPTHGELVFGSVLRPSKPSHKRVERSNVAARAVSADRFSIRHLIDFWRKSFSRLWFPMSSKVAARIVANGLSTRDVTYEQKPAHLLIFGDSRRCQAAVLMIPKRGGAVKALVLTRTLHPETLQALIAAVENVATSWQKRKAYVVHPVEDQPILSAVRACGYQVEGLIREPYRGGQDVAVMSKLLRHD